MAFGGSMIQPTIAKVNRARTPKAAHTRMMSSLTRSALSDAHCSIALRIAFLLLSDRPVRWITPGYDAAGLAPNAYAAPTMLHPTRFS
jgi:hypothetical protein